jgi:uncharacterized membrane protein
MTEAVTETPVPPDHARDPAPADPSPASVRAEGDGEPPAGFTARVRQAGDDAFWRFAQQPAEGFVTLAIVAACVTFVFAQLGPSNVFSDTTPAGGDMGAHVWGPAYLRDELLPRGLLAGWAPDWYAGFPAYQFYMVVPSLAIALLSFVVPYGTAFKLVAISGLVTLPVASWAFGRLTRLPFPVPALLAVAATLFLFDRSFSILGGNIASTLAGEFAFSIALTLAVLYLGVLGRGLEDGKHRGWAAILLALTAVCHPIPFFFALAGTAIWFVLTLGWHHLTPRLAAASAAVAVAVGIVLTVATDVFREELARVGPAITIGGDEAHWLRLVILTASAALVVVVAAVVWLERPTARLWYLATTLPVAAALSAFWTVPFYLRHGYMNDMGWEKKTNDSPGGYANFLFTRDTLDGQLVDSPPIAWVLALAAVGVLMAVVFALAERKRGALFWVAMAVVAGVAFMLVPQGRLWNARLLPFYYLSLYFLAAVGVAYVGRTLAMLLARDPSRPMRSVENGVALVALAVALLVVALPLRILPERLSVPVLDWKIDLAETGASSSYKWWILPEIDDNSFVDSWARWNFTGYEGKPAYPEYHAVVSAMDQIGRERGCGRAMWEHEDEHNRYGTPMALMLLPFWTEGCIGSMEGLYFEASSTTPYHFINQDELSSDPSNAQRDLPYVAGAPSAAQFDQGVAHLQMLGVRYYMAISDRMIEFARSNPALTEIAAVYDWRVFEVADSELVVPLENEPAVLRGLPGNGKGWLEPTIDWYTDPRAWSVHLAAGGPSGWQRIDQGEPPEERPVDPVTVSEVRTSNDGIEFDVSEPGTPILVKASYFPNWEVTGAEGPWRVSPNLMVVVPTSTHVELRYGWTAVDLLGWGTTLVGLVLLVWLFRARPITMAPPTRRSTRPRPVIEGPPVVEPDDGEAVEVDAAPIPAGDEEWP